MARQESDREDLLREATALVERIELSLGDTSQDGHVTAGFRAGGAVSIFFDGDPVYQFNESGELRRAYCDGLLFKAVHGRLVSLRRVRQQGEVQLLRGDLTDSEKTAFLARMNDSLSGLATRLERGEYTLVGQVPAGADVLARLRDRLTRLQQAPIAKTPHVQAPKNRRPH
ncbi:MAG: hypothetical protein WD738_00145 [Pirellulales bacterium]